MYVALTLRAVLPLVLAARTVFLLLVGIFAVVGAPFVARGVRAIVAAESRLDYATAARSLGASHFRLLVRHLLPATGRFMRVELTMLVPAFVVAEASLSFVGLGFPDPMATWARCCTRRRTSVCSPISRGCSVLPLRCSRSCWH
jgi:peptide/nickel transport system permease protein